MEWVESVLRVVSDCVRGFGFSARQCTASSEIEAEVCFDRVTLVGLKNPTRPLFWLGEMRNAHRQQVHTHADSLIPKSPSRIAARWIAGFLLIALAAGVQAQDCTSANTRCIPLITGPWGFGSYFASGRFFSFGSAADAVQANLVRSQSPYTISAFAPNDEFDSLLAMSLPNADCISGGSYEGGYDWQVCTSFGVIYSATWNDAGTYTVTNNGTPPVSTPNQPLVNFTVRRSLACPAGYNFGSDFCYITATALQSDKSRKPSLSCNTCRPSTRDPVDIAEGFMWENVDDIDATGGPTLQRNYNSQANAILGVQSKPAEGFGYGPSPRSAP